MTALGWSGGNDPVLNRSVRRSNQAPDGRTRKSSRCSVLVGEDADRAALAGGVEGDGAGAGGEDGVVAAEADALAGPEAGAALADDDLAAGHLLAGEHLDAEHLRIRFAAVSGR